MACQPGLMTDMMVKRPFSHFDSDRVLTPKIRDLIDVDHQPTDYAVGVCYYCGCRRYYNNGGIDDHRVFVVCGRDVLIVVLAQGIFSRYTIPDIIYHGNHHIKQN